ncbi:hypothetical protein EXIGLDRAFT_756124 [Exidia glandulosa HHB12029]|uniref:MFS general substrate transporter n=1 Tax=Exidia glandulosa HHB12029 TaxID=1314781 RepID=A0A165BHD5_EXIGL|nr:hypothetical protein EXIGLDRAFT_756124 [Exidia glandulosa HHB12029]
MESESAIADEAVHRGDHGLALSHGTLPLRRPSILWVIPLFAVSSFVTAIRASSLNDVYMRVGCLAFPPEVDFPTSYDNHTMFEVPPKLLSWSIFASSPVTAGALQVERDYPCSPFGDAMYAIGFMQVTLYTITLLLNIAMCAWWGQRADVWGRTVVLAISSAAATTNDINLVLVSHFLPRKPHLWLLPGAIFQGLFGGTASYPAMMGYLGDTSSPRHRSIVFSVNGGIMAASYGLGTLLGSWTNSPSTPVIGFTYISLAWNAIAMMLWIFVVPDSFPPEIRVTTEQQPPDRRRRSYLMLPLDVLLAPIRPFSILIPRVKDDVQGSRGREWSLLLLAGVAVVVSLGSDAARMFLWSFRWSHVPPDRADLTTYFTVRELIDLFTKAAFLLFGVLGIVMFCRTRFFKYQTMPVALPGQEEQLLPGQVYNLEAQSEHDVGTSATPALRPADDPPTSWTDFSAARIMILGCAVLFAAALLPVPLLQEAGTVLGISMDYGVNFCLQALALTFVPGKMNHAGKLFGVWNALLQTTWIWADIFRDMLNEYVWRSSRVFLAVAIATLGLSYLALMLVRKRV